MCVALADAARVKPTRKAMCMARRSRSDSIRLAKLCVFAFNLGADSTLCVFALNLRADFDAMCLCSRRCKSDSAHSQSYVSLLPTLVVEGSPQCWRDKSICLCLRRSRGDSDSDAMCLCFQKSRQTVVMEGGRPIRPSKSPAEQMV
jgi:hypothetical protein